MKYIISAIIVLFCQPILAGERGELYQRSIEIADLMYLKGAEVGPLQKEKIKDLFRQIEEVVGRPELLQCKDGNDVFPEIFSWGRSASGPNMNIADAQQLADEMSAVFCPDRYFSVFTQLFSWARSPQGLYTTIAEALDFAELISDFEKKAQYPGSTFQCIQKQFSFARSPGGMSMPIAQAKEFALKRCTQKL